VPGNVELVIGVIQQTLPKFLETHRDCVPGLIHIDVDTYETTKFILDSLKARLSPGTIVLFDDFFGFHNWQNGQARALREFTHFSGIDVSYLACANKEVAIRIEGRYAKSI
jgi:hypothetical protein